MRILIENPEDFKDNNSRFRGSTQTHGNSDLAERETPQKFITAISFQIRALIKRGGAQALVHLSAN